MKLDFEAECTSASCRALETGEGWHICDNIHADNADTETVLEASIGTSVLHLIAGVGENPTPLAFCSNIASLIDTILAKMLPRRQIVEDGPVTAIACQSFQPSVDGRGGGLNAEFAYESFNSSAIFFR